MWVTFSVSLYEEANQVSKPSHNFRSVVLSNKGTGPGDYRYLAGPLLN